MIRLLEWIYPKEKRDQSPFYIPVVMLSILNDPKLPFRVGGMILTHHPPPFAGEILQLTENRLGFPG